MQKIYIKWFQRKGRFSWLGLTSKNFGDDLNPIIVKTLAHKKPVRLPKEPKIIITPCYLVIGSILHWADKNTVVWGTGFAASGASVISSPKEIKAVRGPLSRAELLKLGISCPEIYGDPALLYSRFFKAKTDKKYKLGIITHYAERNNPFLKRWLKKNVKDNEQIVVINVADSVENVVLKINECECIATSSLHGVIIADSYHIPNVHVNFNGFIPHTLFKFYDYYKSVSKSYQGPFIVEERTSIKDILEKMNEQKIQIDLDRLLENCPFRAVELKL